MLALTCASAFAFAGCSGTHLLEDFKERLEEKQNYEVEMSVTGVPLLDELAITFSVDENVKHFSETLLTNEIYVETLDGKSYVYTKSLLGDEWEKAEMDALSVDLSDFSDILSEDAVESLLDIRNYDISVDDELVLTQKEDVEFDFCKDVVLTVSSDSCSFELTVEFLEVECTATVVISNIGKVNLSLPAVD